MQQHFSKLHFKKKDDSLSLDSQQCDAIQADKKRSA